VAGNIEGNVSLDAGGSINVARFSGFDAAWPDMTGWKLLEGRWITPALTDQAVRRNTAEFLRRVDPKDLLDVSTRLDRFPKPVRLVWGAADPFFKIQFARRLRDAFADATLVEIAGGRTFLPLDEPERLADEILRQFART